MSNNINEYLKDCIDNYYKKINKYDNELRKTPIFINDNTIIKLVFEHEKTKQYKCQYLGYLNLNDNKWYWGWILPVNSLSTRLCNDLLKYAIELDYDNNNKHDIHSYIKKILLSNSFVIENIIMLDVLFALINSLLKEQILFIYKNKIEKDNKIECYLIENELY